jgi:RNA polymerase sigma-70 factor (ECF subfamily)
MMSQIRSDAEVINASLTEPGAFAMIFDRHYNDVHRYLARRVGGTTADDLAGQVFLVAFSGRDRYRGELSNARPWLFGIATNLMGKHFRAEGRRLRAYARLNGHDRMADDSDAAVSRLDATSVVHKKLAAALAGMPRRDRDTILLFAWGGLTYEQTALAVGVPVGTVRSRLNRARRLLRGALDASDLTEETEREGTHSG